MDSPLAVLAFLIAVAVAVVVLVLGVILLSPRPPLAPSSPRRQPGNRDAAADVAAIAPAPLEVAAERSAAIAHPLLRNVEYRIFDETLQPQTLDEMDEEILADIRARIRDVDTLPTVNLKISNLLRDPNSSAKKVAELVSTNPLLSAKILRAINSSYYALPKQVTSVGRAITLLGYNDVRSLVIQDSLRKALPAMLSPRRIRDLWLHSTAVSACAHHIAVHILPGEDHDMFTMGLFHDIGKYFFPLLDTVGRPSEDNPQLIQEEQLYGINHALLGSLVARRWKIAELTVKGIEYHHHPWCLPPESIPAECLRPAFILCLADVICRILGYGGEVIEVYPLRQEYFRHFGLAEDIGMLVTSALVNEVERARANVESYIGS